MAQPEITAGPPFRRRLDARTDSILLRRPLALDAELAHRRIQLLRVAFEEFTPGPLDRIAARLVGIETRVEELGRKPRASGSTSRTRINEEAVKKLIDDAVKEQVAAEFKAMRERWTGRGGRGGGGGGGN